MSFDSTVTKWVHINKYGGFHSKKTERDPQNLWLRIDFLHFWFLSMFLLLYLHVLKLPGQSQVEKLEIKSHTGLVLWKFKSGITTSGAVRNWFSLAFWSRFHLRVAQINPVPANRKFHPEPQQRMCPDPVTANKPPPTLSYVMRECNHVQFLRIPHLKKIVKWTFCTMWALMYVCVFSSLGTWRQKKKLHLLPDVPPHTHTQYGLLWQTCVCVSGV